MEPKEIERWESWFKDCKQDWNKFAYEGLGVRLDKEQRRILSGVQHNNKISVVSGTARGKDFVAAIASLCFLILTPVSDGDSLIENTKVILTAPTDRQVKIIMMPEISRAYRTLQKRLPYSLGFKLNSYGIKTPKEEWFLQGFKADDNNIEAWTGFHASHIMFVVTEASGISDKSFDALEGNLQGNSKILIVFNPNRSDGYAAKSQRSGKWERFRLNSLDAENVLQKKTVISGQVDYEWIKDRIDSWCIPVKIKDESQSDFEFEGQIYRPNDLFRVKVLGKFPKEAQNSIVPDVWIEEAEERWKKKEVLTGGVLGVDIAGMGRDNTVLVRRFGNYALDLEEYNSGGKANHMQTVGKILNKLEGIDRISIDTIGEGAGVYSRLQEQNVRGLISCKFSESAKDLTDETGQITFANMKAYLFWSMREWFDPVNKPSFPPNTKIREQIKGISWKFNSKGKVQIVVDDFDSPDVADAFANTFYPKPVRSVRGRGRVAIPERIRQ